MTQQHSHHITQRQHLPLSWKRHYIMSATPPAIPVEQHQLYPARTTARSQKKKKTYKANSSAQVLGSNQI